MTHQTDFIYLDYAAATPLDPEVLVAMQPFWERDFYNPSAIYNQGLAAHKSLEAARNNVASQLGARASEVTFTAGGTEANNLAIHGVMRQYPDGNIITSSIEHESVLAPAGNYEHRLAPVDAQGMINLDKLAGLIDEKTVLVSIMYANNEIGTIQPLKQVAHLISQKRRDRTGGRPLYLHTDACQAAGYLDLQVSRLGVDLLSLNGGKIYGPKQSGALYVRGGLKLEPLISGGGQEKGLRSGTENVAACVGLAKALELAQDLRQTETKRLQLLQKQFFDGLKNRIPDAIINGSLSNRLPNNVQLTIPGYDNERLLIQLDEHGVMAAAGSACSASNEESSHVLRALGLTDAEARASLRFTFGRQTTSQQITRTLSLLASFL